MAHPVRIVIAKPGLDGHDRGAKVVARALRDAGHEVIYTGLRRSPEQIVRAVMDEDATYLGLSSLSGAHDHLFPRICDLLRDSNMGDVDKNTLFQSGMRAIFGPGTLTSEIVDFLQQSESLKSAGTSIGCGGDSEWHWNLEE